MESSGADALIAWIGAHPVAAGLAVFAVAFIDSLVAIGLLMPSGPILFAVGALIGLGSVDATYMIVCAALGAFAGDGLSFAFGHHYGQRMRRMWPFSRYPQWLARGETLFTRHGIKGIVIARYVGAVRPFVPAIAGMLRMPLRSYMPASAFAAATWAFMFLGAGWLLGASLELLLAVAGRLAIVLGIFAALLTLIYVLVNGLYRWFAPRTSRLLERALAWSHRHPVLGRFSEALIDPNRPESASLALLGLLLIGAGVAFFWLLAGVAGEGEPLAVDLAVHEAFFSLRTPVADHLLAMFASLGDWQVLGPAAAAVFAWLLWRRRRIAALHWLAAIGFALLLVQVLGLSLDVPRPPAAMAVPGFGFPSAQVTLATVVYGFFAVLIARELPGRRRAWPYVVAGLLVSVVGFSRLYLGAHWASDVLAGLTLGLAWIAVLGIAYRRRVVRSFWVRPLATLFFIVVSVAGVWHGVRDGNDVLDRYRPPIVAERIAAGDWWRNGWDHLPERRNALHDDRAAPMNLQYAGSLSSLRRRLNAAGWRRPPRTGWTSLLRGLDGSAAPDSVPVLPASHEGRSEVLVMTRAAERAGERLVLRLWRSPLQLSPGAQPVWQGTVGVIRFESRWPLSSWRDSGQADVGLEAFADAVQGLPQRRIIRDGGRVELLLVRQP